MRLRWKLYRVSAWVNMILAAFIITLCCTLFLTDNNLKISITAWLNLLTVMFCGLIYLLIHITGLALLRKYSRGEIPALKQQRFYSVLMVLLVIVSVLAGYSLIKIVHRLLNTFQNNIGFRWSLLLIPTMHFTVMLTAFICALNMRRIKQEDVTNFKKEIETLGQPEKEESM
jgi:hypothetical protein